VLSNTRPKKILQANITVEDLQCLPLVEVAERLIYDESTLNAACSCIREVASQMLGKDLNWSDAEDELTPEQRLAVWNTAISHL
jgi:hypothetical protein